MMWFPPQISVQPIRLKLIDSYCPAQIKRKPPPPFSCICTPRYYYDKDLLNQPNFGLF
jgi:hypothetical protein